MLNLETIVTKQHAVFHYPYFRGLLGAWTNFNAGVGDMKHKDALKRHEDLTQQHQATYGYSILQGNIRDTTCRLFAQAIDGNVRSVSVPVSVMVSVPCPFHVRSGVRSGVRSVSVPGPFQSLFRV